VAIIGTAFTNGQGSGTSVTTASKTWVLNRLYLCWVETWASTSPFGVTPTVQTTGGGKAFTQVRSDLNPGNGTMRSTLLIFLGDGSTDSLTIACSSSEGDIQWAISEYQNTVITGTNGGDAIVQSNYTGASGTAPSTTLAGFADPINNATVVFGASQGATLSPASGYTAGASNAAFFSCLEAWIIGQDLAPGQTQNPASNANITAIELAAATGGGGGGGASAAAGMLYPALFPFAHGLRGVLGMVMRANALLTTNQAIAVPSGNVTLTGDVGSLTLTGFAPSLDTGLFAGVGALTLTGLASSLNTGLNAGVGSLSLAGFAPSLGFGLNAGVGTLSLTGFAPSLKTTLNPGTGQLVLSGFASSLKTTLNPGVGQMTLSGFAASVAIGTSLSAGVGTLTLTGFAPSLVATNNVTLTAGTGTLTLAGFNGTVVITVKFQPSTERPIRKRPRRNWF